MPSEKSTKRKCNALKSIGSKVAAFKTKSQSMIAARYGKKKNYPCQEVSLLNQCLKRSTTVHSDLMVKNEATSILHA
jgi:hypothetical protein